MVKAAGEEAPGNPSGDVEEAGEAEAAGGAAGKDDGLEGVEEHDRDAEDAGNQSEGAHGDSAEDKTAVEWGTAAVACIVVGTGGEAAAGWAQA